MKINTVIPHHRILQMLKVYMNLRGNYTLMEEKSIEDY